MPRFAVVRVLRATRRFQRGVVPLVGEGYLSHTTKEKSFFRFFTVNRIFQLTLGRRKNSKKSQTQPSRIIISEKRTFGYAFGTARPKILKCFLKMPDREPSIQFSGFVAVNFCFREISHRPSDPCSSHLKNKAFWVHMRFFWHKTELAQPKNFEG